jgi:polyhydroxyalkanoate synthase
MSNNSLEQIRQEARTQVGEGAADSTLALNPVIGVSKEDLIAAARSTAFQAARQPFIAARNIAGFGRKLVNIATGENSYDPGRKDRRFEDPAWQKNWFYRGLLQSYLAFQESLDELVGDVDFNQLDEQRAKFLLSIPGTSIAST